MMTGTGHMGDRVRVATGNGAGAPPHCRRRARVPCVRGAPRWSITSQCQRHASHGRRPAHSAHQPCGLGALDAGCKVPGPRRLRSRSASSRGPAEARSPVSGPTRLARGAAAAATKKVAKILIIFSPPRPKGGPARGRGPAAKKVAQGRLKKVAKIFLPPPLH